MRMSLLPRKAWQVGLLAIGLAAGGGSCGDGVSSPAAADTEDTGGETEAPDAEDSTTDEPPEGTADGSTGEELPTGCASIVDVLLSDEEPESTDMPDFFCAPTTGLAPLGSWGYDPTLDTYFICTEDLGPGSTEHLMPDLEATARRQRWLGLFTYRDELFLNEHDPEAPHYVAVLLDIYDDTWIGACGSSQWDEIGDTAKAMQDGLVVGANLCLHTPVQVLSTADPSVLQIPLGAESCPITLHKVFEI